MPEIEPKCFLLGWLTGRQLASMRKPSEKAPVAYLYNGVRLPALPEYDQTVYPYAAIVENGLGSGEYHSCIFANKMLLNDENKLNTIPNSDLFLYSRYQYANGLWELAEADRYLSGGMEVVFTPVVWANFDIYMKSDTTVLYMAATEPVAVYEQ